MMNSDPLLENSNLNSQGLVVKYGTINYRDQEIKFLSDVMGKQVYGKWKDCLVDLGLNNIYYKEDMCRFIDLKLDLITDFSDSLEFYGAKLIWFNNSGYRDIKLVYKGRLIKCFLVVDNNINETSLISESKKLLNKSGLMQKD